MSLRMTVLIAVIMVLAFALGFRRSYVSGIQPGYFEKAEAPAYGVGGGSGGLGVELDKDVEQHFKDLYKEEE